MDGVDPFGLDVIYLNRSNNPAFVGHAGVLVGSEQDGWVLFAKYGNANAADLANYEPYSTEAGVNMEKGYPSFQAFINDTPNSNYDSGVFIKTSQAKDFDMLIAGQNAINNQSYYNMFTYNCQTLADQVLAAGGVTTAGWSIIPTVPNWERGNIARQGESFSPIMGLPGDVPRATHCNQ